MIVDVIFAAKGSKVQHAAVYAFRTASPTRLSALAAPRNNAAAKALCFNAEPYRGAMRMAPSRRMTSPFSIEFSTI